MKGLFYIIISILVISFGISQSSCKKIQYLNTGGNFSFSTDTLTFDTVFTSFGSVTKSVLIINENNKWIKLNKIALGKGNASAFRMNIDGIPTKDISNIDIAPFDSVYIFVAVTVDPTLVDNPFIIEDSIIVNLNGNQKSLPLIAYGQNAIYINDSVLQGNITWTKTKPYVIINSALVDSDAVLNIDAGARIYMHANSKLFVKGSLKCNGTNTDSILFTGDRLDRDYFGGDIPGEWCGLHFLQKSHDNILNYCVIKNGGAPWKVYNEDIEEFQYLTGALIYAEPNDAGVTTPKLIMNNCFTGLSIAFGVLAYNSNIAATNCLFYASGSQNLAVLEGGTYNFRHCTFGNYGYKVFLRHDKYSIIALKNYFLADPTDISTLTGNALLANFTNCIIDGTATEGDEVFIDHVPNWPHQVNFTACALRQKTDLSAEANVDALTNNLFNKNLDFENPGLNDFRLKATSQAKVAVPNIGINFDIKDNARANPTSVGCYE